MTQITVKRKPLTPVDPQRYRPHRRFRLAAEFIALHPTDRHTQLLGVLIAELERAGVVVPEVWACALDEMD